MAQLLTYRNCAILPVPVNGKDINQRGGQMKVLKFLEGSAGLVHLRSVASQFGLEFQGGRQHGREIRRGH
jgi:hypothetical protein